MTTEHTISKIQRLLALSKSDNASEAGSAAAQAQRLMDKHRISMSDLENEQDPILVYQYLHGDTNTRRSSYREQLATAIARHNGCVVAVVKGLLLVTGRESDIQATRCMFDFCVREVYTLSLQHCKGRGRSYANSFRLGCVVTVDDKLTQDRQQQSGTEAIVLIDKRYQEAEAMLGRLDAVTSGSVNDEAAMAHGMLVARNIQLGEAKPTLSLSAGNECDH